jgi:hypothetical protein
MLCLRLGVTLARVAAGLRWVIWWVGPRQENGRKHASQTETEDNPVFYSIYRGFSLCCGQISKACSGRKSVLARGKIIEKEINDDLPAKMAMANPMLILRIFAASSKANILA